MEWPRSIVPKLNQRDARSNNSTDSDDESLEKGHHRRESVVNIDSGRSESGSESEAESEAESDKECNRQTIGDVAGEHRDENADSSSNISATNLNRVEKLKKEIQILTQQLQEVQSDKSHGRELEQINPSKGESIVDEEPRETIPEEVTIEGSHRKGRRGRPRATVLKKAIPPEEDGCPSLQVLHYRKSWSSDGDGTLVKDPEAVSKDYHTEGLSGKLVLKVIRDFDQNKAYWRTRIEICSPGLQDFLDQIPGFVAALHPVYGVYHLTEPFLEFFHNRKVLVEAIENQCFGSTEKRLMQARSHVQLVLKFLSDNFPDVSRKLDDLESETPSGVITYPELCLLYKPDTVVYSLANGEYEAFVVDSIRGMGKRKKSARPRFSHRRLDLTCWSLDNDGEGFGRVWSMHCIRPFYGTREISSLDLIPEKFLPNAAEVKQSLVARGRLFWSLQGQHCREYTGELYTQSTNEATTRVIVDHLTYQRRRGWPISINRERGLADALDKKRKGNRFGRRRWGYSVDDDDFDSPQRHFRAPSPPATDVSESDENWHSPRTKRYRVDYHEFSNEQPYRRYCIEYSAPAVVSKYEKYDSLKADFQPDELSLLVCPQHVRGYCLKDKVWRNLNINQLHPVTYRQNAWDRLVLDPEYKSIIRAMVSSYVPQSNVVDDLVSGKGNGIVALLHGAPGSGKTLTAECVAEAFQKPLYHVTCGDIGTDASRVESRLEEIFDYSTTWGAILLLDEADIFLQDRDYASLKRNALVSMFLRALDYFSGILFLTTNRAAAFDQAFQSRIHVSLGLPVLDQIRRIKVWDIFVGELAAKKGYTAEKHDELRGLIRSKWSKEQLNGRQIRNAVRTALVVAEEKGRKVVGDEEVGVVLRIGREFEGYMSVMGKGSKEGIEGFEEVWKP